MEINKIIHEHRRALREGKKRQDERETQKERRKRLVRDFD
jgi:hypothetical protein